MAGKVRVEDLLPETRDKIGIREARKVPDRIVALGKVLKDLEDLNNREALWALRAAIRHLSGRTLTWGRKE